MAEPSNRDLTPEKRLLELIESSGAGKAEAANPAVVQEIAKARKGSWKALLSFEELKSRINLFHGRVKDWFDHHRKTFGLKELNQALRILVILLIFFFVGDFFGQILMVNRRVADTGEVAEMPVMDMSLEKPDVEFGSGFEALDLGKMFMPYGKRLEEVEKVKKEQSERLVDLTKKLKLTGISYNPEEKSRAFCMIEDVEKNITSFLREGDMLGTLRVKRIEEDRVILESQNEQLELK